MLRHPPDLASRFVTASECVTPISHDVTVGRAVSAPRWPPLRRYCRCAPSHLDAERRCGSDVSADVWEGGGGVVPAIMVDLEAG